MKTYILIIFAITVLTESCQYDYFHDTGTANGYKDCTMWEFFKIDPYNWDSTVYLIERAGLTGLFKGEVDSVPEFTFLGPTNHTIRSYILKGWDEKWQQKYSCIDDIPIEECRQLILSYVIPGRILKETLPYEIKNTLEGGREVKNLTGKVVRLYRTQSSYYNIPDMGPEGMGFHALEKGIISDIASADNECRTGVIHSLPYTYTWIVL